MAEIGREVRNNNSNKSSSSRGRSNNNNGSTRASTLFLLAVVTMSITAIMTTTTAITPLVYAQQVDTCNGHTIERGNFDNDGQDEVRIDGTVYEDGDTVTLDGKTYTVRIVNTYPYDGTDGNDLIVGTNNVDYIIGKEGDDFIVGLGGNDLLVGDGLRGTVGDDILQGGDDILCGNAGNDWLEGDWISGRGGPSNDTITAGNDILDGGDGNDTLYGDYIFEYYSNNPLTGGNDTLHGGAGNDELYGDYIDGAPTITGGDDILDGGDGDDELYGDFIWGPFAVSLTRNGGNDTLEGGAGDDVLVGDGISGGYSNDTLTGGNDTLDGGDGDDELVGDWIYGDLGNDTMQGGNDTLQGGAGNDRLDGDYVLYPSSVDTITGGNDTLQGGDGNDVINSVDGIENNDSIDGDSTEAANPGSHDICTSDPDPEDNCEYDDISTLATLTVSPERILPGQSVEITFTSNVDMKIVLTVTTSDGYTCYYNTGDETLPIIVPADGSFTTTFPDNFRDDDSDPDCNTNSPGIYRVEATVGKLITTTFPALFNVLDTCNGHTIERGDFDNDGQDEVKIDDTVYEDGDTVTLDGKTYTVRIVNTSPYNGTDGNDLIVGTDDDDEIYGKEGDDFIVGLGGNDLLVGDGLRGTVGDDILQGGNDILCGNAGDDELYGDSISGEGGNDRLTGGNDILEGGAGDDELYGDGIWEEDGDDIITGGDDVLQGGAGDDDLYGDVIWGGDGNDTITGGNDTLEGGAGDDDLYGDWIDGWRGIDTAYGGNDVINSVDGIINNDFIDGDYIRNAETANLGSQDICASDDIRVNCEYDDISTLAELTVSSQTISPGQSVQITFSSDVDNIVKITSLTVTTPDGNTCTYNNTLPIIVPADGSFTATFPDDFTGDNCNTNTIGTYTVTAETEVGDPITTTFNTSFNVVPEAVAGVAGIVGAGFLSMLLYRVSKRRGRGNNR